jgi:DNA-directed RNA polymerase alpha subunit
LFNLDECKLLLNSLSERIRLFSDLPFVETKIEDPHFSVRAYNVLKNQGLHTIRDILEFGVNKLPILRDAGERTVKEINTAIKNTEPLCRMAKRAVSLLMIFNAVALMNAK